MNVMNADTQKVPFQEVACRACRRRSNVPMDELRQISQFDSLYECFCPRCGNAITIRWSQFDDDVKLEMKKKWIARMRWSYT